MTNTSSQPIPWSTVEFRVERVTPVPVDDQMKGAPAVSFCPLITRGGALVRDEMWQPGATVTVEVPTVGDCRRRAEAADPLGFVVYVGRGLPHPDLSLGPSDPEWQDVAARWKALLSSASEKLTSRSLQ